LKEALFFLTRFFFDTSPAKKKLGQKKSGFNGTFLKEKVAKSQRTTTQIYSKFNLIKISCL